MKARNRHRLGRIWISAAILLLGVSAGYFVGRQAILRAADSRLEENADRVVEREDELGTEISLTLQRANASASEPCSNADITLLRRLTFASRFLKDVGRVQNGAIACSATMGRLSKPLPILEPDIVLGDNMTIRRNQPLALPEGDLGTVVSAGMTEAVVSPDAFRDLPQQPIHYSVEVADQHHRITLTPAASPASIPSDPLKSKLLRTNKVIRANGALYVGRCSARYSACTIANIRMGEVWQNARSLLYGFLATGTTAGITCATALLLSGSKGRTHTTQLKRAILMGKLSVAYQPIVELGSRRIVGAEALARWTDEEGDSIRPETILALAEAEGFVSEITRFVITRSLRELRPIFVNDPEFRLSVNLAPSDLTDPRLLMLLDEKLSNGPITSNNLAFELPERATLEREIAIRAIQRLRDRGHAVYIDEFGTGYSNLTYLSELNVDGIKINRSFIATLGTESVTASIVPQILAVADALDLKVVVQGIEREEQANYFASDNPGMLAQGWFFGLPVSARSLLFLCEGKSE